MGVKSDRQAKIMEIISNQNIETQEQLDFVKEARCDMIQGYIYARPMPVSEFERWIDQRQSPGNTN